MRVFKLTLFYIVALLIVSGCQASFDKEQSETKIAVEEAFKSNPKETNNKNNDIEFYLPFGYEIEDETPNNMIMKNGSKAYILFYNQQEQQNSKVVYTSTLKQKEFEVDETFEKDNRFGFMLIKKMENDLNELTVGIGGVKISAEVKTKNLASEAAAMMDIVRSVKVK
ncbi:hypothetical protein SM124_12450 [Bacillus sp. 31A1R]|uniref:DUF4367 domain-containing protein n=1 Tax=Robertmurraya mangrovi TaxID=3098077 RepID=A0ABU5IZL6_9BACI|nr:hypothetical protein [Bacillus sp. 31A1R]MDZ5472562.1 hypothetical protein [Bacillus sp. 31A1R]